MTLLFPPFVLTHSIAQTDFWMYNFHLVNFSNNNEQKWQNVWLIQCSSITFTASPKVHSISCPPRYLVLRSQKWSRHNRNNFNTHFIDSKPCKSMHLVKLKLIQGNIIPIRIFHQCCKSSNEPSSTITVMHSSAAARTAAHHVQVYTHSLNLPYSKYSPWLIFILFPNKWI